MFQMCYYHQHACLLVSVSPVCLSVRQTSMDDSGHKGNHLTHVLIQPSVFASN